MTRLYEQKLAEVQSLQNQLNESQRLIDLRLAEQKAYYENLLATKPPSARTLKSSGAEYKMS
jgi:hypothetical protein